MRLALLLLLFAAAPSWAADARWSLGQAEARLLAAGYAHDGPHGAWEAELEIRFFNRDSQRRFSRTVTVEFVGPSGKPVRWKSFVNLAPGTAQHRRLRAPQRMGCATPLEGCPALAVRVCLKPGDSRAELVPVPAVPIDAPAGPPEGRPLWAARVYDGDTFELMDGTKIRLLGVDTPELKDREEGGRVQPFAREAADFTRRRVMEGPVRLAFDGERRDAYGRWLAQVSLEDGSDLNAELLGRGLAKVYPRSEASRLEAYKKIEAQARERGLGLWKAGAR